MENVLIKEQAQGAEPILKVTALLYLKEALVNQQYETCQELVDTAQKFGVSTGDITAVIKDYLNGTPVGRNRLGNKP